MSDAAAAANIAHAVSHGISSEILGGEQKAHRYNPNHPVNVPIADPMHQVNLGRNLVMSSLAGFAAIMFSIGPWVHYGARVPYYGNRVGDSVAGYHPLGIAMNNILTPTIGRLETCPSPIPTFSPLPVYILTHETAQIISRPSPLAHPIDTPYIAMPSSDATINWSVARIFANIFTGAMALAFIKLQRLQLRLLKISQKKPAPVPCTTAAPKPAKTKARPNTLPILDNEMHYPRENLKAVDLRRKLLEANHWIATAYRHIID